MFRAALISGIDKVNVVKKLKKRWNLYHCHYQWLLVFLSFLLVLLLLSRTILYKTFGFQIRTKKHETNKCSMLLQDNSLPLLPVIPSSASSSLSWIAKDGPTKKKQMNSCSCFRAGRHDPFDCTKLYPVKSVKHGLKTMTK